MFNKNILLNDSESSFPVTINFHINYLENTSNNCYTLQFTESDTGFEDWYELNKEDYVDSWIQEPISVYYSSLNFTLVSNVTNFTYKTTSDKIITLEASPLYVYNYETIEVIIDAVSNTSIKEFDDGGIHGGLGWSWVIMELSEFTEPNIDVYINVRNTGSIDI